LNQEIAIFRNYFFKNDINIDGIILLTQDREHGLTKEEDDFKSLVNEIKEEVERLLV